MSKPISFFQFRENLQYKGMKKPKAATLSKLAKDLLALGKKMGYTSDLTTKNVKEPFENFDDIDSLADEFSFYFFDKDGGETSDKHVDAIKVILKKHFPELKGVVLGK